MSIHKTEGIVLKKQNFRETSLIANFYTRDFGKISGILKGIRQDIAKFASTVEPFSYNDIIFYKKINSSLHLISQCEEKNNFSAIRQSVYKISSGSFMMELLDKIMPQEEKNEDIFDLTLAALKGLETSDNPHKIITIFKIKILALSGFKPHLDSCVSCAQKIDGQAKFSLSLGGLLCQRCIHKDLSARSIFRGTVATILHIERNTLQENLTLGMNPQIKKELDLILNSFLNFHLEREIKSQKVLDKLRID